MPELLEKVEDISPALMAQLLSLNDNEVICPLRMKREDVHLVKGVRLSTIENQQVQQFHNYLIDRGFLKPHERTFACLFVYLFNLAFTRHKMVADAEADAEEAEK